MYDVRLIRAGVLLVALGPLGVRVLDTSGACLRAFDVPAYHLVLSDHGTRALALASRGEVWEVSRLNLETGEGAFWATGQFEHFARSYDGARWVVSRGDSLLAMDTLPEEQGRMRVTDRVTGLGGTLMLLERPHRSLLGVISSAPRGAADPRALTVSRFDLPSLTRSSVNAIEGGREDASGVRWTFAGSQLVSHVVSDTGQQLHFVNQGAIERRSMEVDARMCDRVLASSTHVLTAWIDRRHLEIVMFERASTGLLRRASLRFPKGLGMPYQVPSIHIQGTTALIWDDKGRVFVLVDGATRFASLRVMRR